MKRFLSLLLCFCLLFPAMTAFCEGAGITMQVVNCSEWVSLRKEPDPDSVRMIKVPLGAVVEDCTFDADGFVRCSYNGIYGYILSDYLQEITPPEPEAPQTSPTILDLLPNLPQYDLFVEAGTNIVSAAAPNGYSVVVQRAGRIDHEKIMAVCYDPSGNAVWQVSDTSSALSELTLTDAFIAGTEQDPLLVMFVAGKGFHAYGIGSSAEQRWEFTDLNAQNITGGLSYAVATDGSIYLCGFYNNAPLCIAPDGTMKWKAENNRPDLYHPWKIQLTDSGIEVFCNESSEYEGMHNVAIYDYSGVMQQVIQK